MADHDVGSLVVMGGGKMVGMLTFREVLQAVHAAKGKLDGVTVGDVMVRPGDGACRRCRWTLRRLMIDKHSRYLPVMEGEVLQASSPSSTWPSSAGRTELREQDAQELHPQLAGRRSGAKAERAGGASHGENLLAPQPHPLETKPEKS